MQAAYAIQDSSTVTSLVGTLRPYVRTAVRQGNQTPGQHLLSLPWPLHPAVISGLAEALDKALQTLGPGALVAVLMDCTFAEVLEMSLPVRAATIASRCAIWPQVLDLRESLSPSRPAWQMNTVSHFLSVLHKMHDRKAEQGRSNVVRNPVCPVFLSGLESLTFEPLKHILAGVIRLQLHNTDLNNDLLHVLPSVLPSLISLSHLVIDAPEVYRRLQLPELAGDHELGSPQYPWYHLAPEYPGMAAIRAQINSGFKGVVETKAFVSLLEALPDYGRRLEALALRGVSLHISGIDDWILALGRLDNLTVLELDVISTGVSQAWPTCGFCGCSAGLCHYQYSQ